MPGLSGAGGLWSWLPPRLSFPSEESFHRKMERERIENMWRPGSGVERARAGAVFPRREFLVDSFHGQRGRAGKKIRNNRYLTECVARSTAGVSNKTLGPSFHGQEEQRREGGWREELQTVLGGQLQDVSRAVDV